MSDYSTIDIEQLKKLPRYNKPASYHLQDDSGNGCAGDAPGYPTYFTRSVYTKHGNNPARGAQMVISYEEWDYIVEDSTDWRDGDALEVRNARLHKLWKPLPLDHERVRLWIADTYRHHKHCYVDVERPEYGRPGTLIFPVPDYKLKTFRDDYRWSEEYRTALRNEIDAYNREEIDRAAAIAIPENHQAVRIIRKFYPEYQPEPELIANPPQQIAQWWETEAHKPTPETCPTTQRWNKTHPINGSWCQWCGWKESA